MFHALAILYVPLAVAVAGLVAGAATGDRLLAGAAAGLGAVFLALAAAVLNARLVREGDASRSAAARVNAILLAVGWAWAGVAMLAVYRLSGLKWQHGWQYGSGMVLIGGLILAYAAALRDPASRYAAPKWLDAARWANEAQALAAAVALAWLALSGKLATAKDDWAANDIFVAGAAAIVALALIARFAEARRPARDTEA